jgi:molybdopterin synthase sulfur carrier subunit
VARLRLFAALREIAGATELEVPGETVGEVVQAATVMFGERFAKVAAVSSFVVNGERAEASDRLAPADEVAILPPVSGGLA